MTIGPLVCPGYGGTDFGRRTCRGCGAVPDWMSRHRALEMGLRAVRERGEPDGDLLRKKLDAYWAMTPDERRYAESDLPLPPPRRS